MEIDLFGLTVILIGLWQWRQTHRHIAQQPVEITWRTRPRTMR